MASNLNARSSAKFAIAAVTVVSLLPNLSATYWTVETSIPNFFRSGQYRQYLSPGENVIILPYGINGDAMLWQATSNMYFNMVQGWTGFPLVPAEFEIADHGCAAAERGYSRHRRSAQSLPHRV